MGSLTANTIMLKIVLENQKAVNEIAKTQKVFRDLAESAVKDGKKISTAVSSSMNAAAKLAKTQVDSSNATIKALSKVSSSYKENTKYVNEHADAYNSLERQIGFTIRQMIGVYAVTNTIKRALSQGIDFNSFVESSTTAFGVMMKSMDKAKYKMEELYDFAVSSPLTFRETVAASKQLMAYGFAADELVSNMKMLGTVAKAVNISLSDMTYIYGTLRSQGRAYTRDLMQFAMRGIPIYDELAKVLGVSKSEIQKLTEEGKVGFAQVEAAFKNMTTSGGVYAGFLETFMSTFEGKMSMLNDVFEQAMGTFSKPLFDVLKKSLDGVIEILNTDSFRGTLENIGKDIATLVSVAIELGKVLIWLAPVIATTLKALTAFMVLKTVNGLFKKIPELVMGAAISLSNFNLMLLNVATSSAKTNTTAIALKTTLGWLKQSFVELGTLLGMIGAGPILGVVAGIAAITAGVVALGFAIDATNKKSEEMLNAQYGSVAKETGITAKHAKEISDSFGRLITQIQVLSANGRQVSYKLVDMQKSTEEINKIVQAISKQYKLSEDKVISIISENEYLNELTKARLADLKLEYETMRNLAEATSEYSRARVEQAGQGTSTDFSVLFGAQAGQLVKNQDVYLNKKALYGNLLASFASIPEPTPSSEGRLDSAYREQLAAYKKRTASLQKMIDETKAELDALEKAGAPTPGATTGKDFVTAQTKTAEQTMAMWKSIYGSGFGEIAKDIEKEITQAQLDSTVAVMKSMLTNGNVTIDKAGNVVSSTLDVWKTAYEALQKSLPPLVKKLADLGNKPKEFKPVKLVELPTVDDWKQIQMDADMFTKSTNFYKEYEKSVASDISDYLIKGLDVTGMGTQEQYKNYVDYMKSIDDVNKQFEDKKATLYTKMLQERANADKVAVEDLAEVQRNDVMSAMQNSKELTIFRDEQEALLALLRMQYNKKVYDDEAERIERITELRKKEKDEIIAGVEAMKQFYIDQANKLAYGNAPAIQEQALLAMANIRTTAPETEDLFNNIGNVAGQAIKMMPSAFTNAGAGMGLEAFSGADPITGAVMKFAELALSIENVQKTLNPIGTILEGMFDILSPIINGVFEPLVKSLTMFGKIIGKIIAPFVGIVQIVTKAAYLIGNFIMIPLHALGGAFGWLYDNGVVPFGNALIDATNALFDMLRTVTFGIVDIENLDRMSKLGETVKTVQETLEEKSKLVGNTLTWLSDKMKKEVDKQRTSFQDLWEVGAITTSQYIDEMNKLSKYDTDVMDEMLLVDVAQLKTLDDMKVVFDDWTKKQSEIQAELEKDPEEMKDIDISKLQGVINSLGDAAGPFGVLTTKMAEYNEEIAVFVEKMKAFGTNLGVTQETKDSANTSNSGKNFRSQQKSDAMKAEELSQAGMAIKARYQSEINEIDNAKARSLLVNEMNVAIESYRQQIAALGYTASFAVGTDKVPYDMQANIHKGEGIVPSDFMSAVRRGDLTISGPSPTRQNQENPIYVTVNVNGSVTAEKDLAKTVAEELYKQRKRGYAY